MKKNKKGFLLAEETLKIILAVIAIGFLAYLLFSIYAANRDSRGLEHARESLDFLIQEVNDERARVEIYNPNGWVVYSWPNKYFSGIWPFQEIKEGTPQSCLNLGWESCICICKKATPESCDSDGDCRNNPKNFLIEEPIEIKSPPIILSIDYENKLIQKIN